MLRDYVGQNCSGSPGTGTTISLGSVMSGFRAFIGTGAFASGATCFYFLTDGSQAEWGTGTLTAGSPDTLTRSMIGNSAGSGSRLNFGAGTVVYNSLPSANAAYKDSSGYLLVGGSLSISLGGALISTTTLTAGSGSNGRAALSPGDSTHPGFVRYYNASGTSQGYSGFSDGTYLLLAAEGSHVGWRTIGDHKVDGKLNVGGLVHLTGAFTSGTVTVQRLDGSSLGPYTGTATYNLICDHGIFSPQYYAGSDRRIKKRIKTITPDRGLEFVMKSRPVTFTMRGSHRAGFVAQEQIAAGFGETITTVPMAGIAAGADGSPADHIFVLSPGDREAYLTAALQGALAKIDALAARVAQLEAR